MMTSFGQIRKEAKAKGKKRIVIAPVTAATDFSVLSAAMAEDLVFPVLIGEGKAVASWVNREKIQAAHVEIIEEPDSAQALALAIDMLKKGAAEILMRGSIEPKRFFETVLDREKGLLKERVASLVSVFDPKGVDRVTMASDTYINSFPSIAEKVTITENVIRLARILGFSSPKIAALSAIEQVNPAIPSTLDAAILSKMAERGQFGDVTLEGPLDIDCAVSQQGRLAQGGAQRRDGARRHLPHAQRRGGVPHGRALGIHRQDPHGLRPHGGEPPRRAEPALRAVGEPVDGNRACRPSNAGGCSHGKDTPHPGHQRRLHVHQGRLLPRLGAARAGEPHVQRRRSRGLQGPPRPASPARGRPAGVHREERNRHEQGRSRHQPRRAGPAGAGRRLRHR